MRAIAIMFVIVSAGACASSEDLVRRSDAHLQKAQTYAAAGDSDRAAREQHKAFRDYERAAGRAFEEGRPVPAPPPTPPPLPEAATVPVPRP